MDSSKLIRWDIRDGEAKIVDPPKHVSEMQCAYCGHNRGICCRQKGVDFYAWFCDNGTCMQRSSEISKEKERMIWNKKNEEKLKNKQNKKITNFYEKQED